MAVVKNMMVRVGADFSSLVTQSKVASVSTASWATKTTSAFRTVGTGSAGLTAATSRLTKFSAALKTLGIASLKFYAIRSVFTFLKDSVSAASDLTEIQNVVDTAFGDLAYKAEEFASSASASYGLTAGQAKNFSANYMAMATSMGVAQNAAADMSIKLAGLAGDVASFYNIDQEEAYTKLRSVFTGTVKPLTDVGVSMTVANLNAFALTQGITKSWESMSQAEKVMLRYQYVMDSLSMSQGDFARTSHTWANQVRLLSNNFSSLKTIVGKGLIAIFSPFLRGLNSALSALITFGNAVSEVFSSVFGTKQTTISGAFDFSDLSDGVDDLTESETGATSAAKELKRQLMGFDEINKLSDASSSGGSSGSVSSNLGGYTTSFIDEAAEKTGKFSTEMEKFQAFLSGLNFAPIQTAWDELTNSAEKLGDYLGGALRWSMENILQPLAKWTIEEGAPKSIETLANALDIVNTTLEILQPLWEFAWNSMLSPLAQATGDYFSHGLEDLSTTLNILNGYLEDLSAFVNGDMTFGELLRSWFDLDRNLADLNTLGDTIQNTLNGMGLLAGLPNLGDNLFKLSNVLIEIKFKIKETAGDLWKKFVAAWESGAEKAVEIKNSLVSKALDLWEEFKAAWENGSYKKVTIWNVLGNTVSLLWNGFRSNWGNDKRVTIWNMLGNAAKSLWEQFKSTWGTRKVSITNSLANTASSLWESFTSGWGTRRISIVNTLLNSASSLWEQFKKGWSGKTLGLKITYRTNVGSIKKAVYKALGLSGWPTISFAARGGIVKTATLLGNTVVGEAGKEAIIPLENHTEWIDMVADRISSALNREAEGAGEVQNINVTVTLDGRVVGQSTVRYIRNEARAGRDPLGAYI